MDIRSRSLSLSRSLSVTFPFYLIPFILLFLPVSYKPADDIKRENIIRRQQANAVCVCVCQLLVPHSLKQLDGDNRAVLIL